MQQQLRDDKFVKAENGVLYPRAGTLGGCTAHNAMIMVYPNNADWDHVAQLTGDASWGAEPMRRYFQRLEDCHHRFLMRWLYKLTGLNPSRHGFAGWLSTEKAIPKSALKDHELGRHHREVGVDRVLGTGRPVGAHHLVFPGQGRSERLAAGDRRMPSAFTIRR